MSAEVAASTASVSVPSVAGVPSASDLKQRSEQPAAPYSLNNAVAELEQLQAKDQVPALVAAPPAAGRCLASPNNCFSYPIVCVRSVDGEFTSCYDTSAKRW